MGTFRALGALAALVGVLAPPQGQSSGNRATRPARQAPAASTNFADLWLDEWFSGSTPRSLTLYTRIARTVRYDARSRQLALTRQGQVFIARGELQRLRALDRELRRNRRRRDNPGQSSHASELLRIAGQHARSGSSNEGAPDPLDRASVDAWTAVSNEQLTWIERAPWAAGRSLWLAPGAANRRLAARPSANRGAANRSLALALPLPGSMGARGLLQRRGILITRHVLDGRYAVARVLTQDLLSRATTAERRRIVRSPVEWPAPPSERTKMLERVAERVCAQADRPGMTSVERSITRAVGERIRRQLEAGELEAICTWLDRLPYRLVPARR